MRCYATDATPDGDFLEGEVEPGAGKLRVLIVPSAFPSDADPVAGTFVGDHARATATRFEVLVFYPQPTAPGRARRAARPPRPLDEDGIPVFRKRAPLPPAPRWWRLAWYPAFLLSAVLALRRVARKFRPDVIHAHDVFPAGLLSALTARALGAAFVLTVHTSHFAEKAQGRITGRVSRFVLSRAQLVITVSETVKRQVVAAGVDPERVRTVPNPVLVGTAKPSPAARGGGSKRAVVVARLTPGKGVEYLLRAMAQLRDDPGSPSFSLEIAGDGPDRSRLEGLVAELGLDGDVRFLGTLSRRQVREVVGDADLLVLPSLEETFGMAIIEAMAEGKPVLATRCGGPEEIVDPEVGLLVDAGSSAALATGLARMAEHLSDYDPAVITERARAKYSYEAVGLQLELYRSVVD